jgi:hypothetical protein
LHVKHRSTIANARFLDKSFVETSARWKTADSSRLALKLNSGALPRTGAKQHGEFDRILGMKAQRIRTAAHVETAPPLDRTFCLVAGDPVRLR